MNVLHVVSVYSDDGSSGGPVRVASAQVDHLRADGVNATLVGSSPHARSTNRGSTRQFRGVLIPGLGPAGAFSFPLLWWVIRNIRYFDVVHVHLSRDLVTLPVALVTLVARVSLVVQPHGMIDLSTRWMARIIDLTCLRRILRKADAIVALTSTEEADLREVEDSLGTVVILPNSMRLPGGVEGAARLPREVLFLARLHERKRPEMFTQMALKLIAEGDAETLFVLVGPDEGAICAPMASVEESGLSDRITWEGPIRSDRVLDRLRGAYVYVLPAKKEPFGLTIIEALAVGTPAVVTDDAALAEEIVAADCGSTFDGTVDDLARVIRRYLDDPELRERQSKTASLFVQQKYSDAGLSSRLSEIYLTAITS